MEIFQPLGVAAVYRSIMGNPLLTTIIYTSGYRSSQVNPDAPGAFPECLFLLPARSSRRAAWPQHGSLNEDRQMELGNRNVIVQRYISGCPKPCDSSPFSMPSLFQRVVESGLFTFSRDRRLGFSSDGNLPKGPVAQRSDTRGFRFPG